MSVCDGDLGLSGAALAETAVHLSAAQSANGMIPLMLGGGTDPWNHVEGAIALDLFGLHEPAHRAYEWLVGAELPVGAWFASYDSKGEADVTHVDTNTVAYVATGLLAHALTTGSVGTVVEFMPMLQRCLDYVVRAQRADGTMPWSIDADGTPSPHSLVAGSSSLVSSLRHGALLVRLCGEDRSDWVRAADRLALRLRLGHDSFFDKRDYAMDWYYPILTGAIAKSAARSRFRSGMAQFVTDNGVLCRSDHRWVTAAETAEATIAAARIGEIDIARRLFSTLADKRRESGAYLTGLVYPERSEFPPGEETTYSSAAVLIAADVLCGGIAAQLFGQVGAAPRERYDNFTSTRKLSIGEVASSLKRPDVSASR